jgi:EAL and modified HD-GYP domain-containing signal transduction protein
MAATRLVARLQDPDITAEQIAEAISQDLTLSYRLLRLANSAHASVSRKVESIEHAAMLIGTDRIRTWASLLMMSSMDDKPRELMMTAAIRAGMSERLAAGTDLECSRAAFTTGLFSVLDAMLDSPFNVIVDKLPLSDGITRALVDRDGTLGKLLDYVVAYEQDDEAVLASLGKELGLGMGMGRDAYLEAVSWTRDTFRELGL